MLNILSYTVEVKLNLQTSRRQDDMQQFEVNSVINVHPWF